MTGCIVLLCVHVLVAVLVAGVVKQLVALLDFESFYRSP